MSYVVRLTLRVTRRDDGSIFATGKEFPVVVTAKDLPSLQRKLYDISASIDRFLSAMSDDEQAAYLRERGISIESAESFGEFSVPVLVGA